MMDRLMFQRQGLSVRVSPMIDLRLTNKAAALPLRVQISGETFLSVDLLYAALYNLELHLLNGED